MAKETQATTGKARTRNKTHDSHHKGQKTARTRTPFPPNACIHLPNTVFNTPASNFSDVWTSTNLTAAGITNVFSQYDWVTMTVTVTSTCESDVLFGFAGGGGWLPFTVPALSMAVTYELSDIFKAWLGYPTRFEVRQDVSTVAHFEFVDAKLCAESSPKER